MSGPAPIHVGTASWSEPEFVKAGWYPPGLAAGRRLEFYAAHFDMVELNSSFYAIPADEDVRAVGGRDAARLPLRREVPPPAFPSRHEGRRSAPGLARRLPT